MKTLENIAIAIIISMITIKLWMTPTKTFKEEPMENLVGLGVVVLLVRSMNQL